MSATTIEDRVLRAVVEIGGDDPLPLGEYVDEREVAVRMSGEIGLDEAFIRSEEYRQSPQRLRLLPVFKELDDQGLVRPRGTFGWQAVAPTSSGRARVRKMKEEEERMRESREREASTRIVDELGSAHDWSRLDLRLLGRAGISVETVDAALRQLIEDGLVERDEKKLGPLLKAPLRLTETGRRRVAAGAERLRPSDGWREAARLRRELELARTEPDALIRDGELRRRCLDLLSAEADYDRAIREACVVLEDRVRTAIAGSRGLLGTTLMEHAFGDGRPLVLTDMPAEQVGAMQMFRGLVAFYRNPSGHRIRDDVDRERAIRVVVWIDHLLGLVELARTRSGAATDRADETEKAPLGTSS